MRDEQLLSIKVILGFLSLRGRRSKGKGPGRELGRETARERGGRRGTPAKKTLFSPSRPVIIK